MREHTGRLIPACALSFAVKLGISGGKQKGYPDTIIKHNQASILIWIEESLVHSIIQSNSIHSTQV